MIPLLMAFGAVSVAHVAVMSHPVVVAPHPVIISRPVVVARPAPVYTRPVIVRPMAPRPVIIVPHNSYCDYHRNDHYRCH